MLMKGIVLGILFIGIGIAVIYRHRDLYKAFGDIERAEKAFGNSLLIYPLIGAGLIVIGVLFLFGLGVTPGEVTPTIKG